MKIKVAIIAVLVIVAASLGIQTGLGKETPYDIGYQHGCSDAKLPFSERYINQPGKGPSFHTPEFMGGYHAGFNACTVSVAPNPKETPNQSQAPRNPSHGSTNPNIQGARITVSNVHMVTIHTGLIGPSHYEVRGTLTNNGTETSPDIILRLFKVINGVQSPVKTFTPNGNILSPGESITFAIPFTSDEVNAYHIDPKTFKLITDKITFRVQVLFAGSQGEPQP